MSRFDAIKTERSSRPAPEAPTVATIAAASRTPARVGKKAISGYFTAELSQSLNILAVEQRTSLQALLGEAFDDLLRKYGRHPFGER